LAKAEAAAQDPYGVRTAVKPLKGYDKAIRIRPGKWRALCRIDETTDTIIVDAIRHLREAYR